MNKIEIVKKEGVLKPIPSRVETDTILKGTKRIIVREGNVYIGGTANIIHQPEFADIEKMRSIFAAFEEKSKLVKILDQCLVEEGLTIIIGSENLVRELQGLSLVTAPYSCEEELLGTLGVIGPTRMEYSKIVPLVDFTAKLVSRYLAEGAA